MLLRTTSFVHHNFALITLGSCAFYALVPDAERVWLFGAGSSAHLPGLASRLAGCNMDLAKVERVFINNLDPLRLSGFPYLRSIAPNALLYCSNQVANQLELDCTIKELFEYDTAARAMIQQLPGIPLRYGEYQQAFRAVVRFAEGDRIVVSDELQLMPISFSGFSAHSSAFLLTPYECLIVDQGAGYFQGRNLPGCGTDESIDEGMTTLRKVAGMDVATLALPFGGALTGSLCHRHLLTTIDTTQQMIDECITSASEGVSHEAILDAVKEAFYSHDSRDQFFIRSLATSCTKVWDQIKAKIGSNVTSST